MFHGVYVPQLPYSFVCCSASRLLPCPGCYKQCCDEHWGAHVSFRSGFLQHHCSKASILWCSAFFMVQLSYLYMTNGKTIALAIWTFVSKVMSLVFNTLSRFIIAIRNVGSISGSGRSPGGGHDNPLQYSCLENPMDRGDWQLQSIGSQRVEHHWSDLACSRSDIPLVLPNP